QKKSLQCYCCKQNNDKPSKCIYDSSIWCVQQQPAPLPRELDGAHHFTEHQDLKLKACCTLSFGLTLLSVLCRLAKRLKLAFCSCSLLSGLGFCCCFAFLILDCCI